MAKEVRPVFPILYRRASRLLSFFQSLAVKVSVKSYDYMATPPSVLIHIRIYEKRTGRGVPYAPFTIYLNDEKIFAGKTDGKGESEFSLSFEWLGTYTLDVYLFRRELGRAHDTVTIHVFKGHLYDGGAAWWMLGMPSTVWFDERKPSPKVGDMIWFVAAVFTDPGNTVSVKAHVDMILTSPSDVVYNLVVTDNDKYLAPDSGSLMYSCICLMQPLTTLNEAGVWRLTVIYSGTADTTGPAVLDRKEVTFTVSP